MVITTQSWQRFVGWLCRFQDEASHGTLPLHEMKSPRSSKSRRFVPASRTNRFAATTRVAEERHRFAALPVCTRPIPLRCIPAHMGSCRRTSRQRHRRRRSYPRSWRRSRFPRRCTPTRTVRRCNRRETATRRRAPEWGSQATASVPPERDTRRKIRGDKCFRSRKTTRVCNGGITQNNPEELERVQINLRHDGLSFDAAASERFASGTHLPPHWQRSASAKLKRQCMAALWPAHVHETIVKGDHIRPAKDGGTTGQRDHPTNWEITAMRAINCGLYNLLGQTQN